MDHEPASTAAPPIARIPSWAFFACSGKGYAVRLDRVHEIVPPQPLTRLPGCGPEVCGLIGLRGRVVTVFDFGVLNGDAPASSKPGHRLVLIWRGDRVIGLAVDEVVTIGVPDPGGEDEPLSSQIRTGGREFTILDTDRIFGPLLA
jgi:purine-binding chemotaxis protein CheW